MNLEQILHMIYLVDATRSNTIVAHECVQLDGYAVHANERVNEHKGVADNLVDQIYHFETIALFMFSNLILIRFRIWSKYLIF